MHGNSERRHSSDAGGWRGTPVLTRGNPTLIMIQPCGHCHRQVQSTGGPNSTAVVNISTCSECGSVTNTSIPPNLHMQDHQERRRTLSHPIGSPKDFETGRDDRLMHRSDSPGKRDLSNSHAHQSPGWPNPEPSQGMKLCVVCHKRPQYSNGEKHYSTCGRTCAAALRESSGGQNPMCVICGVRPRHSHYPTCGLTCKAKLESRDTSTDHRSSALSGGRSRQDMEPVPSVTYSACLMCWKAPKQSDSDYCGRACSSEAERRAVLLLEAPQGHVTFQSISEKFQKTWCDSSPCPEVLKVYKIVEKHGNIAGFEKYRHTKAPSQGECSRWHGTTRECDIGDLDDEFCSSLTCLLCSTIQNSFDIPKSKAGIHTSATSSQSDFYSESTATSSTKMLLLTDVTPGINIELTSQENRGQKPDGFDSVRVISQSSNGKTSPVDDLIVYTANAIRPLYLVVYR